MKLEKVVVGPLQENCYILTIDDKTLSLDTDYTKVWKLNDQVVQSFTVAGGDTATVTGIGNYTGTATGTYELTSE